MNITEAIAVACSNDYERGRRDASEFDEVQFIAGQWIGRTFVDDGSEGISRGYHEPEELDYVTGDYLDGLAAGGCAVLEPIAGSWSATRAA
jgi:hypothetical protein